MWSTSSETDFFTRLWVHFGTPLFAGWCPRTPSLGQGMIPARLSVLCELRSKRVVYLHLVIVRAVRDGCWKSKRSPCASSFVWNWEEMVRRHLKCWELPSVSSVWAVLAFSNGTRDLKKAETQLMTVRSLADWWQAKLTTVLRKCEN